MLDIEDCLRQVMAIQGALSASVIDYPSGSTIGRSGRGSNSLNGSGVQSDHGELTAAGAAQLVRATVETAAFATIGRPDHVEDVVITAGNGYHLVHLLPSGFGGRLVLYVWLDRSRCNLAMAQRSVRVISEQFVAPSRAALALAN